MSELQISGFQFFNIATNIYNHNSFGTLHHSKNSDLKFKIKSKLRERSSTPKISEGLPESSTYHPSPVTAAGGPPPHQTTTVGMDNPPTEQTTQEKDQIHRSVKKYKRPATDDPPSPTDHPMQSGQIWADLLRRSTADTHQGDWYCGEGEPDEDDATHMIAHDGDENAMQNVAPGRIVIEISPEECKELWKPWRRAIVVKLLGRNISYRMLSQRLSDMWTLTRRIDIIDMENGYYVIRFSTAADYEHVLENGPWTIQGHYLTVSKFRPGFLPAQGCVAATLVWVRLPSLPLEFFHESILKRIGNKLGRAVKIDVHTMTVSRGKYARICVEMDLQKPLVSGVIINGTYIKVEYESLHQICFTCGKYGHRAEECPTNQETRGETVPEPPEKRRSDDVPSDPFGPWMLVRSTARRRQPPNRPNPDPNSGINMERERFQGRVRKEKENQAQDRPMGGTRFAPLVVENTGDPTDTDDATLASRLQTIQDDGPTAIFRASTKEQLIKTRERKGKGIQIRDMNRIKIQTARIQSAGSSNPQVHQNTTRKQHTILQRPPNATAQTETPLSDITNGNVMAMETSLMEETLQASKHKPKGTPTTEGENLKSHPPDKRDDQLTCIAMVEDDNVEHQMVLENPRPPDISNSQASMIHSD